MSLVLRAFRPADADVIVGWLKSEYLMRQWCADRYECYPVTPDDMRAYYACHIDGLSSVALTMVDGDEIIGYATLRIPAGDRAEWRLGFVIVDDAKRGRGLGKSLVDLAVRYAFTELGAAKVTLGVFGNNPAAIRCYEAAGFRRVPTPVAESYLCLGETWSCIEMERRRLLSEMSLQVLWQLFPVTLEPHRPTWEESARREIGTLHTLLYKYSPLISHIGSTAIPAILSKPIVDILVEIPEGIDLAAVGGILSASGYICMSAAASRLSFNKGYTPEGYADEVFHIHVRRAGDNAEIGFRDYLIAHPDTAAEYEALKLSLLPKFRNDRDAYTDAKSEFVRRINRLAEKDKQLGL